MWGAWAQMGGLHPELFDYNDHFTLAQAGDPFPGNANYPIKALAELDNTCRWAVGFTPNGSEPGLCQHAPTPTPYPTATRERSRVLQSPPAHLKKPESASRINMEERCWVRSVYLSPVS